MSAVDCVTMESLVPRSESDRRRPLHFPSADAIAATQLSAFVRHCEQQTGKSFPAYADFERFAIAQSALFWPLFLRWSEVLCDGEPSPVATSARCEEALFFPRLTLNYVSNLLRLDGAALDASRPALTAVHMDRPAERWTRGQLRDRVTRLSAALSNLGLLPGDRVAMVAYNNAAAVVGALSAAAIGCTLSTGAPDMGSGALINRFAQLKPVLLMADLSGAVGGLRQQQQQRVLETIRALPSLRHVLLLDDGPTFAQADLGGATAAMHRSSDLQRTAQSEAEWPQLPFNHPLFVLFTSGTTGAPKCLLHGAGGTLLEHIKEHRLHCDLRSGDKLFFQSSIGWMMWNWQLSALASGVEIVLYDGPMTTTDCLWQLVAEERVSVFGTSPGYLQMCERNGLSLAELLDFTALRAVLSTGSILHPRQQDWVWSHVKALPVQSISGGTDIIGCFVLGNPNLPVYSGECQSRSLGLDVQSWEGELICANPFPSRPLGLLDDPDGSRFHAAYFSQHDNVWTHGDLIEFTAEGSARMLGRCDGVLNIRGIRIGPAEIYRVLDGMPEIVEAMAVEQYAADEPGNARLVLLVVLRTGSALDDELHGRIRRELGRQASAAHVPALIIAVDELPTTHSGKRSARAARDALNGAASTNAEALRNPECLEALRFHAARAAVQRPAWGGGAPAPVSPAAEEDLEAAQARITRIWEQALGTAPIRPGDNFFDLGGESVAALRIIAELKKQTGRDIPLTLLFDAQTVASFAVAMQQIRAPLQRSLKLLRPGRSDRPLYIVHGFGGTVMELRELSRQIEVPCAVYGVNARGFEAHEEPLDRVEDMAREYLREVRDMQPHGPYLLAGYSFGGLVAYEMARILQTQGERIGLLVLFDTCLHERCWPPRAWLEYFLRRTRIQVGARWRGGFGELRQPFQSLRSRWRRRWDTSVVLDAAADGLPEVVQRIQRSSLTAFNLYRPSPVRVPIRLFRSDLSRSPLSDPYRIWRPLAENVQVYDVPGDHREMIRPPSLSVLSSQLSACLQAALTDAGQRTNATRFT
jgi:acetoacetyl-CoA synthetase